MVSSRLTKSARSLVRVAVFALVLLILGVSFVLRGYLTEEPLPFDRSQAIFVGRAVCAECHVREAQAYQGSHHDLAMDVASDETVLGDFSNAELEHHGSVFRMFRRNGDFWVTAEGNDGQMREFKIDYVFGFTPLQQYMVKMDESSEPSTSSSRAIGRVQVLRVCWDTKQRRWFHLDPPDVHERLKPEDPLHWTGVAQRWNTFCADCHSTNLLKGFDIASNRYHTTFSEIDVSCEACHGPGSYHAEFAKKPLAKWKRGITLGLAPMKASPENQIQVCAPCHSRRQILREGSLAGDNFYDNFSLSLLTRGVYFADGQVEDEDYIHGSFIQSKMYHKGIRCTDCHDPHTAKLKASGNQVCTNCHQHPTAKYDSPAHHFHKTGGPGAQCIDCHMPPTTYMNVDPRHDHSIRIPRPDMSISLGTPNACTGCHINANRIAEEKRGNLRQYLDWLHAAEEGDEEIRAELARLDQWCNEACDRWYGETRNREEHFAFALQSARRRLPQAKDQLVKLINQRGDRAPAIARATALNELLTIDPQVASVEGRNNLRDPHPLVRAAAIAATAGMDNRNQRATLLQSLLNDPIRSVRIEAVRGMADSGAGRSGSLATAAYQSALSELENSLLAMRDRGGAQVALGILAEQHGRNAAALRHYEDAIRIDPHSSGARNNLAALLEQLADEHMNRSASTTDEIRQSKDLAQTLRERARNLRREEWQLLERDVRLLPKDALLQYRVGLSRYLHDDYSGARSAFESAIELDPHVPGYHLALALLFEKLDDLPAARETLSRGLQFAPDNQDLRSLKDQWER